MRLGGVQASPGQGQKSGPLSKSVSVVPLRDCIRRGTACQWKEKTDQPGARQDVSIPGSSHIFFAVPSQGLAPGPHRNSNTVSMLPYTISQ